MSASRPVFGSFRSPRPPASPTRRPRPRRLMLEHLEDRHLLSVAPSSAEPVTLPETMFESPNLGTMIAGGEAAAGMRQLAEPAWVFQGPAPTVNAQLSIPPEDPVCGAIQSIAPHPTNADILYIGAVNGGVWKTTNATAASPTWTQLTDSLPSQSIGAVAFDTNDTSYSTLLVGTGRLSNFAQRGDDEVGLYYTTNGGTSWSQFNQSALLSQKFVAVAARGAVLMGASNSGTGGVFRSSNTGATWTNISGSAGLNSGSAYDLVGDPGNASRFYAAIGGASGGLFRSDDSGATWTNVTGTIGGMTTASNVRAAVHNSTGNNVVYVAVAGSGGALSGVYRSTDQGGSWTAMDVPSVHPGTQAFPDTSIAADPTNPNLVYIAGDRINSSPWTGNVVRGDASLPPGSQFTSIVDGNAGNTTPHADTRHMMFDANRNLLQVDDGGIYRRSNPTSSSGTWGSVVGNLGVAEAHDVAWNAISHTAMIGTQDNGTQQQPTPAGSTVWQWINGGDGGDVAVDSTTLAASSRAIRYLSSQYLGGFYREVIDANNNYVSWTSISTTVVTDPQFVTPIELNAIDPRRLLIGGSSNLYESLNQGDAITSLGGPGANRNAMVYGGRSGGLANPDLIYVGSGATVYKRTISGGAIAATSALPTGAGTLTDVAVDPDEWNRVFAVDSNQVFMSTDAGSSWSDITGNLGLISSFDFRTIEFVPGTTDDSLAIGSRSGVFSTRMSSAGIWAELGTGLPDVLVYDLDYNAADRVLVAGTLGRSVWSVPMNVNQLPTISNVTDQTTSENTPIGPISFTVGDVQTPAASLTVTGTSSNTTLVPNGNIVFGGGGTSRTVTITPAANRTGTTTITLTVTDGDGGSASDTFVCIVQSAGSATDLRGALVDVPNLLSWGQTFSVEYQVRNDGDTPVSTDLRQDFYLSTDQAYTPGVDVLLGTASYTDDIPAKGAGPQRTASLALPSPPPVGFGGTGPFYIAMLTDAGSDVNETNESNNNPFSFGQGIDSDSFTLTAAWHTPIVVDPIDDVTVLAGSPATLIQLDTVFQDLDLGDSLTYRVIAPPTPASVVGLVSQSSYTNIHQNLLYTHTGDNRGWTGPEHDLAQTNIFQFFNNLGFTTTLEPFQFVDTTFYNVVAEKRGVTNPGNVYLVGAHYDSDYNPGADDNGSGVAAVMEAARVLSSYQFDSTIRFVAFDLEEQGLLGSTAYATAHAAENILGMVDLDMIAYNPASYNRVTLYDLDQSGTAKSDLAAAFSTYASPVTATISTTPMGSSDHVPFEQRGFDAVMAIESRYATNPNYHQPTDAVETTGYLDYAFATSVTKAATGYLVDHAGLLGQTTLFQTWIVGNSLNLTYAVEQEGSLDCVIRATDTSGAYVEDTFRVTVNLVNHAPVLTPAAPALPAITENDVGESPVAVATGDFNGDGKSDLAVANSTSNTVGVLLGNGSGGFSAISAFPSGGLSPVSVAVGDFNGDGKTDLAVANSDSNTVGVLLGNGSGSFSAATTFSTGGTAPVSVAVGDFNGDGKADLAVANRGSNTLGVLLGTGSGSFSAAATFTTGGLSPVAVAVADFNADGRPDLVVANSGSNTVGVLLGTGSGGFSAASTFATGGAVPVSVAIANFNADGTSDLAVANAGSDTVALLLGTGSGGFLTAKTFGTGGTMPNAVAVADFDADGKNDLAVVNHASDTVAVLVGNGSGSLSMATAFNTSGAAPNSVAVADFNADGKSDLAVANTTGNTVDVLLGIAGRANGSFSAATTFSTGGSFPKSVAVGDFNGDGKSDLAVANSNTIGVLLANGSGSFSAAATFSSGGVTPNSVAVGDFNADGKSDLAVANQDGTVGVLLNTGSGSFSAATTFSSGGSSASSVAVGDFNGDGKSDVAVATGSDTVGVLLGNGSGSFSAATTFSSRSSGSPASVAVGDFNGDGKSDLAVASGFNTVGVLLGNGSGGFSAATAFASGGVYPYSVAVADFDGDGNSDLAVGDLRAIVGVLFGDGSGGFFATAFPTGGMFTYSVAVGDFNADAMADLAVPNFESNTVGVYLNNGSGSFSAPTTFSTGGSYPKCVAVGDFNADGTSDLAVANTSSDTVGVLLGRDSVTFSPATTFLTGRRNTVSVASILGTSVTDSDAGALKGIAISAASGTNGAWSYSIDGGNSWTALPTIPNGQAFLLRWTDLVSYLPDGENGGSASLTYYAWDQTGATLNQQGTLVALDTTHISGPFSQLSDTVSLSVASLNDAPVLDPSGNAVLSAVAEDTLSVGDLVSELIASVQPVVSMIRDVDAGAKTGIAVVGLDPSAGSWQYSTGGFAWIPFQTVSPTAARLLDATARIRLMPSLNFNSILLDDGLISSAITFRAWDETTGVNGGVADTTATGGTTAFSAALETASLTITAVNDPPVKKSGTIKDLIVYDDAGLTSLGLNDIEYTPGGGADELTTQALTYRVTVLPSALGTVFLGDGSTLVIAGNAYPLLELQKLMFKPNPGSSGGPFPFQFTVTDNGTTNGLPDPQTTTETITITVWLRVDKSTPGMFDPQTCTFYLRNSNTTGAADLTFAYGDPSTPSVPLVGDWNGDGVDGIGLFAPATSTWYLRDSLSTGYAEYSFGYGDPGAGWTPLVGDWNGDGRDTVGFLDAATGTWYLRNSLTTGFADETFGYGDPTAGWAPLVGDWNGDHRDTIGFFDPVGSTFYLRNSLTSGYADVTFSYGPLNVGWKPLAGDWDGVNVSPPDETPRYPDSVGLYDPASSAFYLRNSLSSGYADLSFGYGTTAQAWVPLTGRWPEYTAKTAAADPPAALGPALVDALFADYPL